MSFSVWSNDTESSKSNVYTVVENVNSNFSLYMIKTQKD